MDLSKLKPLYFSNEDDLDHVLFYPILKKAKSCKCMTGYFTSGSLKELSLSLSYFLSINNGLLEFLVSPNLEPRDLNAIKEAIASDSNLIPLLFPDFELSEDTLRNKTVEALSYLVATKKLELRLAIQDEGLFHTKCWLFETNDGRIAVHGSGNATTNGLTVNFEQLTVSRDWVNEESLAIVNMLEDRYLKIWHGEYNGLTTIRLNKSTIKYLSNIYESVKDRTSIEISDSLRKYIEMTNKLTTDVQELKIPSWLNYTSGDYAHQGRAIKAWNDNNGRGILSIATGGGKTLTSLVAATLISQRDEKLLLIIAVPTKPLLGQWAEDVQKFGVIPVNTSGMIATRAAQEINNSIRRLKIKASKAEVVIITHEALKNETYLRLFKKAEKSVPLMLIGDEVHNLGSIGFQQAAPAEFTYRLGLSATAERQTDYSGTQFLLSYFGPIVFEYPLSEAIGTCLVPYQYHVHKVELDEDEAEDWANLTHRIKKLSFASKLADGAPEKELWQRLCIQRRRIVESAKGKISAIAHSLPKDNDKIRRTLIFGTDKHPNQLNDVNQLLINRKILFHQVTGQETKDRKRLKKIIESFSNDRIQVLTSKRVLDEGFNVPQTEVAYLLASNTILRQWIQRLGRVLRKSDSTNKTSAELHDFAVIPPIIGGSIDTDLKSLITGELSRLQFFDELSTNGLEVGGTSYVIEELLELLGAI